MFMKQCPQCSAQCPDEGKFCHSCGKTLSSEPSAPASQASFSPEAPPPPTTQTQEQPLPSPQAHWQETPVQQPIHYNTGYQQPTQPALDYRSVGIIKKYAGSKQLFAIAIILSVSLFFSVLSTLFSPSLFSNPEQYDAFFSEYLDIQTFAFNDFLENGGFNDQGFNPIATVSANVVPILICIGFWLIYTSGKAEGRQPTGGYTLIRVASIFSLVSLWVAFGAVVLIFIVLLLIPGYFGSDAAIATIVLLFFTLFFLGIVLVLAFYYGRLSKSLKKIINTMRYGQAFDRFSPYVRVMLIITGVISAISAVFSSFSFNGFNFFGFLSGGCTAAGCFMVSTLIGKLNKELTSPEQPEFTPYTNNSI